MGKISLGKKKSFIFTNMAKPKKTKNNSAVVLLPIKK